MRNVLPVFMPLIGSKALLNNVISDIMPESELDGSIVSIKEEVFFVLVSPTSWESKEVGYEA